MKRVFKLKLHHKIGLSILVVGSVVAASSLVLTGASSTAVFVVGVVLIVIGAAVAWPDPVLSSWP